MAATEMKTSRFLDNTFVSKLMQNLEEQRKCNTFCDVVLRVCDTNIRVHSNILAAASPYFHTFLGQGEDDPRAFSQNTPQVIEIHIEGNGDQVFYGEAVRLIVDYLYTGEISVSSDNIQHITELSKIMGLYKLISFCEWFVRENKGNTSVFDSDVRNPFQQNDENVQDSAENLGPVPTDENVSTLSKTGCLEDVNKISPPKRKRGRPRKIIQKEENEIEDAVSVTDKTMTDGEQSDDGFNEENTEDEICVSEFPTRSGRKRKLTSKMKELKSISSTRDCSPSDLRVFRKRDKYGCVFCPYSTNSLYHYQRHSSSHKLEKNTKKYTCDTCGFSCEKAKELLLHRKEHLHEKHHCDLCEYYGETKEDFENHMKMHENPLPYFCKYCDQRFRTKTQLNFHYPKHSKLKPFVCKLCNTGFKWKHALKNHMVTHSTTKEHLCDVCGFATAHKSQLKAHKLVHTGETFKCPHCNFEATRRQNLKYHLLTHTREKPHQCDVCGQSFSLIKNMKRHMLLHTNERPYKCDQCTFSTTRFDKLKEHLKKQHGQGEESKKAAKDISKYDSFQNAPKSAQAHEIVPAASEVTEVVDVDVLSTIQALQIQVESSKMEGIQNEGVGLLMQTPGGSLQPVSLAKLQEEGAEILCHFVQVDGVHPNQES